MILCIIVATNEVNMKSVFIMILLFAIAFGAMQTKVFDVMSSPYTLGIASIFLVTVFIFAFKILGNPFAQRNITKEQKNDEEQD